MSDITTITQLVLQERQAATAAGGSRCGPGFADDTVVRLSWLRGSGADFVTASEKLAARGVRSTLRLD